VCVCVCVCVCELDVRAALRYVHNGDEVAVDNFTVSARLRSQSDRRSRPTTVYVDVIQVNDQRPTIRINAPLHLWTGILLIYFIA